MATVSTVIESTVVASSLCKIKTPKVPVSVSTSASCCPTSMSCAETTLSEVVAVSSWKAKLPEKLESTAVTDSIWDEVVVPTVEDDESIAVIASSWDVPGVA